MDGKIFFEILLIKFNDGCEIEYSICMHLNAQNLISDLFLQTGINLFQGEAIISSELRFLRDPVIPDIRKV